MPFDPLQFEAELRAAFPEPERPKPSPLSNLWDTSTQFLKSIVGVTGGVIPKAISGLLPEEYEAAQKEMELAATGGEERPLSLLEKAEAMPGLGDVLAQTEVARRLSESPVGALAPVTRLVGNIAGDPTSYTGVGAFTKLGKAQKALETAVAAGKGIDTAADALRFAEGSAGLGERFINSTLERLSRPGAFKEGAEAALRPSASIGERVSGLGRAAGSVPFSPLPAVAYLPEIAEGIGSGVRETFSQAQEGNFGQAGLSGINTILQAGLAGLMGKGLIDEATAREVLIREATRGRGAEATPRTDPEGFPAEAEVPVEAAPVEASVEAPTAAATPVSEPTVEPVREVVAEAAPEAEPLAAAPKPTPPSRTADLTTAVRSIVDAMEDDASVTPKGVAEALKAAGVDVTGKDVKERLPQILKSLEEDLLNPAPKGGGRTRRARVVVEGEAPQTAPDAPVSDVAAPPQPSPQIPIEAKPQEIVAEAPTAPTTTPSTPVEEGAKVTPPKIEASEDAVAAAHIENNLADRVEALHKEGLRSKEIAAKLREEFPDLDATLAETGKLTDRAHHSVENWVQRVRAARKGAPKEAPKAEAPEKPIEAAEPTETVPTPSQPPSAPLGGGEGPSTSLVGAGRHESEAPSDIIDLQGRGSVLEREIDEETGKPRGPAQVIQKPIVQDIAPRTSARPLPERFEPETEGSVTLPPQPKPEVAKPLTREEYAAAHPEEVEKLTKQGRRLNTDEEANAIAQVLTGLDVEGLQTAAKPKSDSPAGEAIRKMRSPNAQDFLANSIRRLVFHNYGDTATGKLLARLVAGDEAAKNEMVGLIKSEITRKEKKAGGRKAAEAGIVGAPSKGETVRTDFTTEEGTVVPEVERAVADRGEESFPAETRMGQIIERLKKLPASKRDKDLFMAYRVQPHLEAEKLGIDPALLERGAFADLVAKAFDVSKDTVINASKLIEMQVRYSKPEKGYPGIQFQNNQKWKLGSLDGKFSRQLPKRFEAEAKLGMRAKIPESYLQMTVNNVGEGAKGHRDLESMIVGLTAGKAPSDLVEVRLPKRLPEPSQMRLVRAMAGNNDDYLSKKTSFLTSPLKRVASEGDFDVYRLTGATVSDMRPGESTLRKASEALTPEETKARMAQYVQAVKDGPEVIGTKYKVADLDGDSDIGLMFDLSRMKPLANAIGKAADEMGKVLGDAVDFRGFTPSSFLKGTRGSEIGTYLNPLHAFNEAGFFVSRAGNIGDEAALKKVTAAKLADSLLHEALHAKVRGHGPEFAAQRAELIRKLGPSYKNIIDTIESGLDVNQLRASMPEFSQNVRKNLGELSFEREFNGRKRTSDGARTDQRGAAPIPGQRGGVEGRPPSGVGTGTGAREPVRGGPSSEAGRPGAGPQLRGTVPEGDEAAPSGGGSRGVISDNEIKAAEPKSPEDVVNALIRKGMSPEKARFLTDMFGSIPLKHTLQELIEAGPQEKVDISVRMKNLPGDPEVKARLAQALEDRGRIPKTVSWDDLDKATLDFLGVRSTDEAIRALKQSGLRDGKDVNTLRSVAGFYLEEVSKKRKDLMSALQTGNETKINDVRTEVGYAVADMLQASEVLSGGATNIGRALNAFRKPLTSLDPRETLLRRLDRALTEQGIKKRDAEFLTDQYSKVMDGDLEARNSFLSALRLAQKPEKMDMVLEAWKAGLLGYPTQIANIASNALFRGMNEVESGVAVLLDKLRSTITGTARERYLGELPARWAAQRKAMSEGLLDYGREMADAFTLKDADVEKLVQRGSTIAEDIDVRRIQGFIPGKTGNFVRFPFRSLEAADAFFKHVARSGEYAAIAYRLAQKGKGKTEEILSKIWEASKVPQKVTPSAEDLRLWREYKDVLGKAEETVQRAVFQKPLGQSLLGRGAKLIQTFGQQHKPFQFIAPFTRTPANILDEALTRTPLGMLHFLNKARKEGLKGLTPEDFDELAKSAVGTSLMGGMVMAGMAGNITGAGPQDPALQETLRATGWQPYSFKVGDQYISYSRFEPMASLMGMAADVAEGWKRGEFTDTKKTLERLFESVTQNVTNKTFLAGLEGLFSAIHDPFRYGEKFISQLQSTIVPNIAGPLPVATLARAMDPTFRQTEALTSSPLQARIPGASEELPAQLTPLGEERQRGGTFVERLAAPFTRTQERKDPQAAVAREFDRLNWSPRKVERFIRTDAGGKVDLTSAEIERLNEARQMAIKSMWRVINDPTYKSLPDEEDVTGRMTTKKDVLERILRKHQRQAMQNVRPHAMARALREQRPGA